MRLSVSLLIILILNSVLTLVISDEAKAPVKKRGKLSKLFEDEEEPKKVKTYESEEEEHVFKRGNKYKDVSEEDDESDDEKDRGKKGLRWNKSFKNHKFNTYEEFDRKTGNFKKDQENELGSSEEQLDKKGKRVSKEKINKEGAKKYFKSKNDKSSKEFKTDKKNIKGKPKRKFSNIESDEDSDQIGKEIKVKELRPLEKVRTRSVIVKRSMEVRRRKREDYQSSEEDDHDDTVETEECEDCDAEDDDDSERCNSSEDSCDVK